MAADKTWFEHYAARMNDQYRDHMRKKYAKHINMVASAASKDNGLRVAEIGCGAANITRLVSERIIKKSNDTIFPRYVILDSCPQMLGLARANLLAVSDHVAQLGNALDLGMSKDLMDVDVFHSHGVLEHFRDGQINVIINEQKRMASRGAQLIHYVPSAKYEKPSFGDERLMTPDQWFDICMPDDIIEFNDGYDLILKWSL